MSRGKRTGGKVTGPQIFLQLVPGALLAALFAAVGILHVTSRVLVVDAGYRLSRLEAENRQLTLKNDRLRVELAMLESPAHLERLAREQLGLRPPPAGAVVTLKAGAPASRPAGQAGGKPQAVARAGPP
jgi:cell division protein FtsL